MQHINVAMRKYLEGKLAYHQANYNTFTSNMVGVAEHGDYMETLEKELENVAKYQELLDALTFMEGPQNLEG